MQRRVQIVERIRERLLRPHEIDLRAGHVFPAHHEVGAELHEVEIGFVEAVILLAVAVFVNGKMPGAGLDFAARVAVEAAVVFGVQRVGYVAEIFIQRPENERLAVVLHRQIGRDVVAEAGRYEKIALFHFADDGALVAAEGCLRHELILSPPTALITGGQAHAHGV